MIFFNPLTAVKPATPEGHTGAYAHIYLPFSTNGYWFASGQKYVFTSGEIIQRHSRPVMGLTRPDSFRKDCCGCAGTVGAVV